MIHKISENLLLCEMIAPQDVASATTTACTTWHNMELYDRGVILCQAYLSNTKTAIFTLLQASTAAGSGSSTISTKTVTLTGTTADPYQTGVIDFTAHDLYDSDSTEMFVGVQVVTNQDGDDVAAVGLLGGASYKQATLPSAT